MIVMVSTTNTASAGTNPLRCFAVIGLVVMESKANEYSMSTTHATEAELFGREHTETRRQQEKLPCLTQTLTHLLRESTLVRTWRYGAASKHGWCYWPWFEKRRYAGIGSGPYRYGKAVNQSPFIIYL